MFVISTVESADKAIEALNKRGVTFGAVAVIMDVEHVSKLYQVRKDGEGFDETLGRAIEAGIKTLTMDITRSN